VRLQNQMEALLEEAHSKLSSLVMDLLGVSARRMLKALADGETNPAALAALADERLRATPEQLCAALGACTELNVVYRRLLKMALEELRLMASLLSQYQDAFERCPVWEWTRRSRSSPKSVPLQQPFPPRNVSPRGSVLARVTTRALA